MKTNTSFLILLIILIQSFLCLKVFSQPLLPQHSISVTATQAIHFGTICLSSLNGTGGTVTVDYQGNRSSTGDVMLISSTPTSQPAIFDIKLCQGRNVIITYSPTITLTGSNGGSMIMNLGPTEYGPTGTSFPVNVDCDFITQMRMGGTLNVGNYGSNPEGTYTGSFSITFNQE
ncbi:MAG: DUF4402 domain-containing protein [Bacteroidetes bacterium]|nr:DUF4402 domain-containing protein [Bacteroidota bacterium]